VPEGKGEEGNQRGGAVDQTPGSNPSVSQLGGAGLKAHCAGDTAERLAAEGRRPRGEKRDQRTHRYWCWCWAENTMCSLEWQTKTWVAALEKG
jgi:hypothetical protein